VIHFFYQITDVCSITVPLVYFFSYFCDLPRQGWHSAEYVFFLNDNGLFSSLCFKGCARKTNWYIIFLFICSLLSTFFCIVHCGHFQKKTVISLFSSKMLIFSNFSLLHLSLIETRCTLSSYVRLFTSFLVKNE